MSSWASGGKFSTLLRSLTLVQALGSEASGRAWVTVDMTTMHHIPGASLERYIGHINLSLIKTSNAIREVRRMDSRFLSSY